MSNISQLPEKEETTFKDALKRVASTLKKGQHKFSSDNSSNDMFNSTTIQNASQGILFRALRDEGVKLDLGPGKKDSLALAAAIRDKAQELLGGSKA